MPGRNTPRHPPHAHPSHLLLKVKAETCFFQCESSLPNPTGSYLQGSNCAYARASGACVYVLVAIANQHSPFHKQHSANRTLQIRTLAGSDAVLKIVKGRIHSAAPCASEAPMPEVSPNAKRDGHVLLRIENILFSIRRSSQTETGLQASLSPHATDAEGETAGGELVRSAARTFSVCELLVSPASAAAAAAGGELVRSVARTSNPRIFDPAAYAAPVPAAAAAATAACSCCSGRRRCRCVRGGYGRRRRRPFLASRSSRVGSWPTNSESPTPSRQLRVAISESPTPSRHFRVANSESPTPSRQL